MAHNRIICERNDVDYSAVRKAMCAGARTVGELKATAHVCGECPGCTENLGWILSSVCGCKNVSLQEVVTVVQNGAGTVEKVGEVTGAGTVCGRCKVLIENVIAIGR